MRITANNIQISISCVFFIVVRSFRDLLSNYIVITLMAEKTNRQTNEQQQKIITIKFICFIYCEFFRYILLAPRSAHSQTVSCCFVSARALTIYVVFRFSNSSIWRFLLSIGDKSRPRNMSVDLNEFVKWQSRGPWGNRKAEKHCHTVDNSFKYIFCCGPCKPPCKYLPRDDRIIVDGGGGVDHHIYLH